MAKHVINQLVHIQLSVHITTTVKKRVNDIRIGIRECTRKGTPEGPSSEQQLQ